VRAVVSVVNAYGGGEATGTVELDWTDTRVQSSRLNSFVRTL